MDSWLSAGAEGVWRRAHRTPRRMLFTPFRVAGGPEKGAALKKIRVTRGKYLGTQQGFQIIDDYSMPANSHRVLKAGWTGVTEFREAEEYIEESTRRSTSTAKSSSRSQTSTRRSTRTRSPPGTSGASCYENVSLEMVL